jgi:hypothetical protein
MFEKITIYVDGTLSLDSLITGYCVKQTSRGTEVGRCQNNGLEPPVDVGETVTLPSPRYALSCYNVTPASGVPNVNTFKRDLLAIFNSAAS